VARSFFVVIRGPLGVGKSTVSRRLARRLRGEYISIDRILDDDDLWYAGRLREFLAANRIAVERALPHLEKGTPVVFDGNFYWKTQISDLLRRLDTQPFVFSLTAPLRVCVARDALRDAPHGSEAARKVYSKSTRFSWGRRVNADRPVTVVVDELLSLLPPRVRRRRGRHPRG
jgi:predicted kinase